MTQRLSPVGGHGLARGLYGPSEIVCILIFGSNHVGRRFEVSDVQGISACLDWAVDFVA